MQGTSYERISRLSISSVHSPPQHPTTNEIGPLIFTHNPQSHHRIFSSPSLSPQISPPFPNLSLSRFLHTSSSILPSTTTSISSQIASFSDQYLAHNSLQLITCAGRDSIIAFFPTGCNSDKVGFLVLSVEDLKLNVSGSYGESDVYMPNNDLNHRIVKILVSPLADCECISDDSTIGYLLVHTNYSIHYYNIRITIDNSGKIAPSLELIGNKLFKTSSIAHACWNPHLPKESLILLENGDLFLFDLDSSPPVTTKKVKLEYNVPPFSEKGGWLSCDFSWDRRIIIIVHSSSVFLVDLRLEKSTAIPLIEDNDNDRFLAFSVVAHDRFYFTLATNHDLFLCDIRKPMILVSRLPHNIANPSYVLVSSLSELRSQSEDVTYNWSSENGFGILLGSFWNGEFSLFCYGPNVKPEPEPEPVSSYCAWGLPSSISLITNECNCGSCIVKEEFSKDQLPNWINWQQKKELVLGFGILDKKISSLLFKPDVFGGFSVITLTSSGNLELNRYCASWDYSQNSEKCRFEQVSGLEDSVLYETNEEGYNFKKKFIYLKLDWLDGYLNSNLSRVLSIELNKNSENEISGKSSFGKDFHENICEKINTFGSGGYLNIHDVFKDISLPTSIHEIALRKLWSNLPKNILRFGFLTYSDIPDAHKNLKYSPFEFMEVPCQQPHLPPFFFRFSSSRSSKWSKNKKPGNSLVGPVIPVPFLMSFHKTQLLKTDFVPADSAIDDECNEAMKLASEITSVESQSCVDHTVSLADDNEDVFNGSQNLQSFCLYKPTAGNCDKMSVEDDEIMEDFVFEDEKYTNLVYRNGQKDVKELFDSNCGIKFKFDEEITSFGPKELKSYKLLKRQFSNFKEGFSDYYITKSNIHHHFAIHSSGVKKEKKRPPPSGKGKAKVGYKKRKVDSDITPSKNPKEATCYYCQGKGHWKISCPKYLEDLKSQKVQKSGTSGPFMIELHSAYMSNS